MMYVVGVLLLVSAAAALPISKELYTDLQDQIPAGGLPEVKPDAIIDHEKDDGLTAIPDQPLSPSTAPVNAGIVTDPSETTVHEIQPAEDVKTPDEIPDKQDECETAKDDVEIISEDGINSDNYKVIVIKLEPNFGLFNTIPSLPFFQFPNINFPFQWPSIFNRPKFHYPGPYPTYILI